MYILRYNVCITVTLNFSYADGYTIVAITVTVIYLSVPETEFNVSVNSDALQLRL